jgi:spermidine synthase
MRKEIYTRATRFHRLSVTEDGGLRVLRFERNPQSSMLIEDPFETDIEYVGYLHTTLAVAPEARRTLALGLGGGSVVKQMWRDYPAMTIDAVELDPAVVKVAYRYFALPRDERIRVITGEARRFLEKSDETWDIILVDAFDDYEVPRRLITEEFMMLLHRHLAPEGVVAYNYIGRVRGDRSRPFRSVYRTGRNVFRQAWVFVVTPNSQIVLTEDRNLVMLLTDAVMTPDELLGRIRDRVGGMVTVPGFEAFGEDLHLEPIRAGDVPFILDETKRGHGRHRARP